MKIKKLKVNFLFDRTNNWINKFIISNKIIRKNVLIKKYFDYRKIKNQEIVFVLSYTKKLPKKFLNQNKLILIIHESRLPKGKGFSPVQWQILENKNKIVVSLILASNMIDSGEIILKDKLEFNGTELYEEIREKQALANLRLINKFLINYPKFKKNKQKGTSTYYRRRIPEDSEININKNIKSQINLFRISNNNAWPSYFIYKNKKYILKIYKKNYE